MPDNNALHDAAKAGNVAEVQAQVRNFDINVKGEFDGTPLYWAAREGKREVVNLLLTFKPDVNIPDNDGSCALFLAASNGYTEIVQDLLKVDGINVNHADNNGSSTLIVAAENGLTDIVQDLLMFDGINVNHADKHENTALIYAADGGQTEIVLELLKIDGINVNHADKDGKSALNVAVQEGHTEIVQELLKIDGINVNHADKYDQSALIQAAEGGYTEIVQELLKIDGININQVNKYDQSALILAAENDHTEIVQELLKIDGINVNHANSTGKSALIQAAENGHTEIVQELLKIDGINVNHADAYSRQSALNVAARNGQTEVVQELLKIDGINVNHANNVGQSVLIHAAEGGYTEIVQELLKIDGININQVNKYDQSALIQAAEGGYTEIVQELLMVDGINVNQVNSDCNSALNLAAENGRTEIVQDLLDMAGINVNHANNDGDTSLHYAAKEGRVDAFVALLSHEADTRIKNKQGKTCFDVMKSAQDKLMILTKIELNQSILEVHNFALWFVIVQEDGTSDADLFAMLLAMVEALVSTHPTLAAVKDTDGRAAVDVASKPMKSIIQSVLLWHGRYRITEPRPEHISATCFVFKAVDEHTIDSDTSQPIKVALKLMRLKDQFQREISTRDKAFNQDHVMHILQTHPQVASLTLDSWPNEVMDVEADATGQLTKTNAEKFYMLVMPLAERNLFVALKQERWAGKNMEEVRHVFVQLVNCVEHMHEKGVLHADLKTLNIVRTAGQWKLIDLDAACVIGVDKVGHKSSSAYVPPEAIFIDQKTDTACVRSVVAVAKGEATYDLLTAHPSFDVWSLGCIMYQMCTTDVKPPFQGGQDDNLIGVRKGVDNLFALAEWSPELKAEKLADDPDKLARNLLSQILHKDPLQRPSLARVLAHPFLSGKKVARLVGEKPKYDVFLSYRVASDAHHLEKLYNLLTAQGFKVYWDKLCLLPGVDWEQGFCEGLVSSRAFVPLLSRDAINHPDKAWQNFSKLTTDQPNCDNVFLEYRLAVELQGLGLIEKMFPVFIGNLDATTLEYSHYFGSGCHPALPGVTVKSVEEKLRHHMESQALGTPIVPDRTVKSVVDAITACQGAFIVGPADATFADAAASIAKMLTDVPVAQSPRGGTHVHQAPLNTMDIKAMAAEISMLKSDNSTLTGKMDRLENEIDVLKFEKSTWKSQRETALASLRSGQFVSVDTLAAHMEELLKG